MWAAPERLVFQNRAHFFSAVAEAMRRIRMERAQRRISVKRVEESGSSTPMKLSSLAGRG
jgi:hypothetical protein